jgi:hypothetical protein
MPAILIRFAASGYDGAGKLTAVPLSTPPETGRNIGLGAGGGGSESSFTLTGCTPASTRLLANSSEPAFFNLSVLVATGKAAGLFVAFTALFAEFCGAATVLLSAMS